MATLNGKPKTASAVQYAKQAEKLSLQKNDILEYGSSSTTAVEARFITPQDPVIETADGGRLPAVPLREALKLNKLRDEMEEQKCDPLAKKLQKEEPRHKESLDKSSIPDDASQQSKRADATLRSAIPPESTHPLFPDLPLYGPPTLLRNLQCLSYRCSSAVLSLAFLTVIVLGSAFTSIPLMFRHIGMRLRLKDPNSRRPFYEEEKRRQKIRKKEAHTWKRQRRRRKNQKADTVANDEEEAGNEEGYIPTEGGKDPLVADAGYYARRVGLDIEVYKVQTEDGFIIDLWHVYNPRTEKGASSSRREHRAPIVFPKSFDTDPIKSLPSPRNWGRRYPVLLIHGLLQSAGAYCTNDDDSLAFFLCKSGYDVWLGNNRCGSKPHHQLLHPSDPRMWSWNIRQMGVMDLSAFISRVLAETGFSKLGLVCHSQGTTETFVALAKGQRPDLGTKISVFCALAPAVYAGPLIGKMYFKFMRIISPAMFRIMFGIHSFIPFMMSMHRILPGRLYGALGYRVFSFLFNWTDDRWDQGIRHRLFQFSPVYVSAESMRWWLGRECFATQKCILATREEGKQEDREDKEEEEEVEDCYVSNTEHSAERMLPVSQTPQRKDRGRRAWYDEQVPPFALWVAGSDELVDGRRLLRRFKRGREPHVRIVHSKVIEEYEHLDVIWALDSVEKVAKEVREVLWKTVLPEDRARCSVPVECHGMQPWEE